MAITTTREQRRIENRERAMAAYMGHHAAAVALVERIHEAIENHDISPESESITWGDVGSMEHTRHALQALSDWLFNEGEYAEA